MKNNKGDKLFMKNFFYFSNHQINDNKKASALFTLLFSSYLLFIYRNMIPSIRTNIPSEAVLKKIYSIKYFYTKILDDDKSSFNIFERKVLTNVLYILNNGFNKKDISEYLKYDIAAILQYVYDQDISQNHPYVEFVKFFCNLYNLNEFDGDVYIPKFIFDKDLIIVRYPLRIGNVKLVPENNISHMDYFHSAIYSILKEIDSLEMVIVLCDILYVEYSHLNNFTSFSITEICRKIVDNKYDFSILKNYRSSTIISFIFTKKLTKFLFFSGKRYDRYMYSLINLDYYDYELIKKELSTRDSMNISNYHMKNIYGKNKSLEALDDEDTPDDEPIEDDAGDEPNESNIDDPSDDDPGTDDDPADDAGDSANDDKPEEPPKKENVIKFKFKLADPDESLEDFLYKIHVYKVIDEYLNKEESNKLSHTKRTVLKNWLTKWIFLLSASETKLLLNDFKIKL